MTRSKRRLVGEGNVGDGPCDMYQVVENLARVVERHVAAGGWQRQTNAEGCTIEQFMKMGPPSFSDSTEPLEAEAWIAELEKIFEVLGNTDKQRVTFAAFMLKGEADQWWKMVKRLKGEDVERMNWEDFRKTFYDKYFPQSVKEQKEIEFLQLTQGNRTVAQYEAKFTELSRFARHMVDTEPKRARKFENGLNIGIRSRISTLRLMTYADVVERALIAERDTEELLWIRDQQRKRYRLSGAQGERPFEDALKRRGPQGFGRGAPPQRGNEQMQGGKKDLGLKFGGQINQKNFEPRPYGKFGSRACFRCNQWHPGQPCRWDSRACFTCGQLGHIAKNCQNEDQQKQAANNTPKPKATGRVYALTQQDAKASQSVVIED